MTPLSRRVEKGFMWMYVDRNNMKFTVILVSETFIFNHIKLSTAGTIGMQIGIVVKKVLYNYSIRFYFIFSRIKENYLYTYYLYILFTDDSYKLNLMSDYIDNFRFSYRVRIIFLFNKSKIRVKLI